MGTRSILGAILAAAQLPTLSALPAHDALPTTLQTCLGLTGAEIVYPNTQTYDSLSKPQNSNYQAHPQVIVIPGSTEEVAATVKCVSGENGNVKLSPRGGGHSYAAYSFSGEVVLDPGRMKGLSIDEGKKEVTVQFGQTLGPLATALGSKGYALPHGTCPTVGVAGHSMGGGWGFSSRKWGWLVDRIVGVEFVDVSGNIKHLSPSSTGHDAELWWGVRGAGSNNFGVVTAFTFSLEQAPTDVVNYELYFGPESDCVQVLLQVQELGQLPADSADGFPLELGIEVLLMGRDNKQNSACILQGQYLGKRFGYEASINKILHKLSAKGIKPIKSESKIKEFTSWVAALTDLMGPLEAADAPLPYYAQSAIDSGAPAYDQNQVKRIFDGLRAARRTKGSEPDVSFDLLGPDAKTNLPTSTGDMAYIHRKSLFLVQIYSAYFPGFGDPVARQDAVNRITGITSAVRQTKPGNEWHSYQNYIDPHLANFGREYYGDALERLKALKIASDPNVVFDFPQGLSHV
ncbi:FAD-binding domain-containing protein [Aspergillus avenaceus]|uniref:FAD-binding domain-containing protein n=1 Tax=Aspergillus avenaceus TaxID=36643 RepID=A0A5N6U148_ASPAV|nr:FAD-binding domain-containing protein [Aspergillus avenaceus]